MTTYPYITVGHNPAASIAALLSRLSPKYHALVNPNAQEVENVLDKKRRRDPLEKEDVQRIFSLRYNGGIGIPQIAKVMQLSDVTVATILKRKHKLSRHHPKHPKETP